MKAKAKYDKRYQIKRNRLDFPIFFNGFDQRCEYLVTTAADYIASLLIHTSRMNTLHQLIGGQWDGHALNGLVLRERCFTDITTTFYDEPNAT